MKEKHFFESLYSQPYRLVFQTPPGEAPPPPDEAAAATPPPSPEDQARAAAAQATEGARRAEAGKKDEPRKASAAEAALTQALEGQASPDKVAAVAATVATAAAKPGEASTAAATPSPSATEVATGQGETPQKEDFLARLEKIFDRIAKAIERWSTKWEKKEQAGQEAVAKIFSPLGGETKFNYHKDPGRPGIVLDVAENTEIHSPVEGAKVTGKTPTTVELTIERTGAKIVYTNITPEAGLGIETIATPQTVLGKAGASGVVMELKDKDAKPHNPAELLNAYATEAAPVQDKKHGAVTEAPGATPKVASATPPAATPPAAPPAVPPTVPPAAASKKSA